MPLAGGEERFAVFHPVAQESLGSEDILEMTMQKLALPQLDAG